jgi:hypothetical protein
MDENTVEFNCLRKSNRWPMIVNYNMLNIATNNAFILMKASQSGYTGTKVTFLQNLTFQLSQSYVRGRKLTGEKLVMARRLGYAPVVQEQPQRQVQKRKRCYACGVTSRSLCDSCGRGICPAHKRLIKKEYCLDH